MDQESFKNLLAAVISNYEKKTGIVVDKITIKHAYSQNNSKDFFLYQIDVEEHEA